LKRSKIGQKCHFLGLKMVKNEVFEGPKNDVFTMKWVFEGWPVLGGPGQKGSRGLKSGSKKVCKLPVGVRN